jgi:hypothetical protein
MSRADRLPLAQGVRRDELLNGEVLDTPDEAKVLVEAWRKAYNRIRPHSSLGYRPPWSETPYNLSDVINSPAFLSRAQKFLPFTSFMNLLIPWV